MVPVCTCRGSSTMSAERKVIGFITPPRYADPAPAYFPSVIDAPVLTQQSPLPLLDLAYDHLSNVAWDQTSEALQLAARTLAAMGCDLIVQMGTPFGFAGALSEGEARERQAKLERAAGRPVVMTALALIDGLQALGVRRPALACTYYDATWRDAWMTFVRSCGFEVAYGATLEDERLVPATGSSLDVLGWRMTDELVEAALRAADEGDPEAEAVVVTGTGSPTLQRLAQLERIAGKPVLGADWLPFWAAARRLDLSVKPGSFGCLQDRG